MPNSSQANNQDNNLTIKYYLGIIFPKYNHPAKLHDEIDIRKVDQIKNSQDTTAYYIGFYQNKKLVRFEKHLNNKKILEFSYKYDKKGKLIEIEKKNFD